MFRRLCVNTIDISIVRSVFQTVFHCVGRKAVSILSEKPLGVAYRKATSRITEQRRSFTLSGSHHVYLYLRHTLYFKLPLTKLYSSVTNDKSHVVRVRIQAFAFTRYSLPKVRTPRPMHRVVYRTILGHAIYRPGWIVCPDLVQSNEVKLA